MFSLKKIYDDCVGNESSIRGHPNKGVPFKMGSSTWKMGSSRF